MTTNMLREKIDGLIAETTASRDFEALNVFRLIKTEFQKYNASKEAVSKPMDDGVETTILKRMVKQRKESADMYSKGGREDLAEKERMESLMIEGWLPAPVTEDQIRAEVEAVISSGVEPVKKNMGQIIKEVKSRYPAADGKLVSEVVMSKLN